MRFVKAAFCTFAAFGCTTVAQAAAFYTDMTMSLNVSAARGGPNGTYIPQFDYTQASDKSDLFLSSLPPDYVAKARYEDILSITRLGSANPLSRFFMRGRAESAVVANPTVMKGSVTTNVLLQQTFATTTPFEFAASANVDFTVRDRITFAGLAPGQTAYLLLTQFADNKITTTQTANGAPSTAFPRGSFAYNSLAEVYSGSPSYGAGTLLRSSDFKVCDILRQCLGNAYLSSGSYGIQTILAVNAGDALYITNNLKLEGLATVGFPNQVALPGKVSINRKDSFSNSGYTLLEMLTPGVDYISDSGTKYLTALPSAVPEPASWAMLIAGFGLTGAAMRRQRRETRAVAD